MSYLEKTTNYLYKLNGVKPESTEVIEFIEEQMEVCYSKLYETLPFDAKNYWNSTYLVLSDVLKKIKDEINE